MKFLGQKNITQSDINCPAITFPVKYTELIINKLGEGESKVFGPRKRAFPMKVHKNRSTGRVVFTSVKKFFDMYDVSPGVTVQLFEDDQQNFWMLPERKDFCAPWENAGADLIMKKQVVESEMRSNDKVFIWLTSKPALIRQIHTSNSITVLADNGKLYTFQASVERLPKVAQGLDALCCWKWSRVNEFITELKVQVGDYLFLWSDVQHRLRVSCQSNPGTSDQQNGQSTAMNQIAADVSQGTANTQFGVKEENGSPKLPPLPRATLASLKAEDKPQDGDGTQTADGGGTAADLSGLDLLAAVAVEDLEKKKEQKDDGMDLNPSGPANVAMVAGLQGLPPISGDLFPGTREIDWSTKPQTIPLSDLQPSLPGVSAQDAFPSSMTMSLGPLQGPPTWYSIPPPRALSGHGPPAGFQPSSPSDELAGALLTNRMGMPLGSALGAHTSPPKGPVIGPPPLGPRDSGPGDNSTIIDQITSAISQIPPSRINGGDMSDLVNVLVNALQKNSNDGREEGRKRMWAGIDGETPPSKRAKLDARAGMPFDMSGPPPFPEPRFPRGRSWSDKGEGQRDGENGSKSGKKPGYGQNSYFQSVWRYEAAVESVLQLNDALYNMIKERHVILREIKDGEFQSKYKSLMLIEQELVQIRKQLHAKFQEAADIIASSDI